MAKYAENTAVSSGESRNEIERTLVRFGASQFIYAWCKYVGKPIIFAEGATE